MKHTQPSPRGKQLAVILVCVVVGFAAGYGAKRDKPTPAPTYASAQEIEAAKNAIAVLYSDQAVDGCWQVNTGADLAVGKYQLTYRYIRVNKYANRAIITDCGEHDTLLAKDIAGEWVPTGINIMLDNRVNSVWQKACLIDDITVPDDTVRPENGSIDGINLQECNQLNQ